MGDVATHRKLYEDFIRPHLPAGVDPIYVELGNYLTDVSQLRDPFAHMGAKSTIWKQKRSEAFYLRLFFLADLVADMDGYLDTLMGIPAPGDPRGRAAVPFGALAGWFREMIFAYSVEKTFRQRQAPRAYLIAPPELRRLYDTHYTQYFPHEHLDFPPGRDTGRLDDFSPSRLPAAGGGTRRVAAYVERHLDYLGDLLTRIERDWAHVPGSTGPAEHDHLVRFGHACHAIEDFFFHSNFTDLSFALTGAPLPQFTQAEVADDHDPHGHAIPGADSPRWQRIHYRRRRRPVLGDDGETFSNSTSLPGELVFTGSYGSEDVFHSLIDAIGFLTVEPAFDVEPMFDRLVAACNSAHPMLELMSALALAPQQNHEDVLWAILHTAVFSEQEADRKRAFDAYKCLIKHGAIEVFVAGLARTGGMHRLSADAVTRACAIERRMMERYSLVGMGVLGFLIELARTAKERSDKSIERSAALDTANLQELTRDPATRTGYTESDNGASAERVGTHSLLARDSVRKQPLRRETINLGGFAVSYVARTMADQRAAGAGDGTAVDWQQLLRHFMGHPEQAPGGPAAPWWRPVLGWDRTAANRPPEVHTVQQVDAATVAARAGETTRADLEQWYNDLVAVAERRYRAAVTEDFVIDSLINGGMLCAIVSPFAAWAAGGSFGSAMVSIPVGLITGAGLSGVFAGLGAAIDDRTGAVVGMIVGITGSVVASIFLAKLLADNL